jgi:acetylornithine/N-succinyldiaminopimelate aminotransferase
MEIQVFVPSLPERYCMTEREIFFSHLGLPSFTPLALDIVKADGIYLYDRTGKKYIDFVSGISVSNIGHRHPEVIEAIRLQLEKYLYLNVYGEYIQSPQVGLAKRLVDLLPQNLDSVYFVNSGSEAVEGAVKLSKRYSGRTEIIAFRNAYHGSTQGALSILGNEELKNAFRPLVPDIRHLEFNNVRDLSKITARTACVVSETIQAEAGILLPENDFLKRLRERCDQTGTLLVIDDVQMGFGRTGKLFSFEHFGIIPDILVLAKALGSGMPIGAFISSREIMSTLSFDPELGHITTFGGHPVSCAAALAGINVLTREKLIEEAEEKGSQIEQRLANQKNIRMIRRRGLMIGVELEDPGKRKRLTRECLERGLIIDWFLFNPATFRIAPPLTITNDEIEIACNKMEAAFSNI